MTLSIGLMLVSCDKGYNHSKEVTNHSGKTIQVISGCCGQTHSYSIEPRASEIVFQCLYQFSKPDTEELSWDFQVVEEDGTVTDLSSPNLWQFHENKNSLDYKYIFK